MDLNYDAAQIKGKTILITGGASGFGAAFGTRWAAAGATVILGDINPSGEDVTARIRQETQNENVHFIQLDVTSWTSQVNFFRESLRLSPHGGIDTVVANAGINDDRESSVFENPKVDYFNDPSPPAPSFKTLDVNITGVMYTVHLALFFLPKNPGSTPCRDRGTTASEAGQDSKRDRHILLLGSVASLHPLMTQAPYTVSKHGVLGLFRCLRISAPLTAGIRVNIVCPYYTDTPFMQAPPRALLAGVPLGKIEDVVDAASYLVADTNCIGRSLVTGPKLKLDSSTEAMGSGHKKDSENMKELDVIQHIQHSQEQIVGGGRNLRLQDQNGITRQREETLEQSEGAVWECYLHDMEPADIFTQRMLTVVHAKVKARGWAGWAYDMAGALTWPVRQWWNSRSTQS